MVTKIEKFKEEWKHFCACIDFGNSFLDARAIKFMNEFSVELKKLIDDSLLQKLIDVRDDNKIEGRFKACEYEALIFEAEQELGRKEARLTSLQQSAWEG